MSGRTKRRYRTRCVPNAAGLSTVDTQGLARWTNLSETTSADSRLMVNCPSQDTLDAAINAVTPLHHDMRPHKLIFLPGAGGHPDFWRPMSEELRHIGQHVLMGSPGFGGIPNPNAPQWFGREREDLSEQISGLNISKTPGQSLRD
jgi:hypothetical protein